MWQDSCRLSWAFWWIKTKTSRQETSNYRSNAQRSLNYKANFNLYPTSSKGSTSIWHQNHRKISILKISAVHYKPNLKDWEEKMSNCNIIFRDRSKPKLLISNKSIGLCSLRIKSWKDWWSKPMMWIVEFLNSSRK